MQIRTGSREESVCTSLRASGLYMFTARRETAGILIKDIDLNNLSIYIQQEIRRFGDEAHARLPKNDVTFVFPKQNVKKDSLIY